MKTRIFLDTNVVLDLLANRDPHFTPVAQLASLAEKGELQILVSPLTFATVNYILSKHSTPKVALEKLQRFSVICEVSAMQQGTVDKALHSSFADFEDGLQYFSAIESGCLAIITRNSKDFKASQIPIMTAEQYLASLKS